MCMATGEVAIHILLNTLLQWRCWKIAITYTTYINAHFKKEYSLEMLYYKVYMYINNLYVYKYIGYICIHYMILSDGANKLSGWWRAVHLPIAIAVPFRALNRKDPRGIEADIKLTSPTYHLHQHLYPSELDRSNTYVTAWRQKYVWDSTSLTNSFIRNCNVT